MWANDAGIQLVTNSTWGGQAGHGDPMTNQKIAEVERKLNMRPRKRLGYRAPIEAFCDETQRQNAAPSGVVVIG